MLKIMITSVPIILFISKFIILNIELTWNGGYENIDKDVN